MPLTAHATCAHTGCPHGLHPADSSFPMLITRPHSPSQIVNILKFKVKEIDPSTGARLGSFSLMQECPCMLSLMQECPCARHFSVLSFPPALGRALLDAHQQCLTSRLTSADQHLSLVIHIHYTPNTHVAHMQARLRRRGTCLTHTPFFITNS